MDKLKRTIEILFYLFLLILPWQTRLIWQDAYLNGFTWEYGRLSLYGTEIFLWGLLLLYGFWLYKTRSVNKVNLNELAKKFKKPSILIYWLLVLFVLWSGASVIFSVKSALSYYHFIRLIEATALMSMVLVLEIPFKRIAFIWIFSALTQSIFAIWQWFVQYVPANKWLGLAYHYPTVGGNIILETSSERWLRAYGSLPHPNILGGFLALAIILILYFSFKAQNRTERLFVLISLVFIYPALFFTFSRSAWLGLLVSLFLMGLWLFNQQKQLEKKIFFKVIFLIILLSTILAFNFWQPIVTRLQGKEPLEVNSIQLRYTFNEQAIQVIKDHPLTGSGIGAYTYGVYETVNGSWPGYYYQPVHNIYLLVFAELGVFGFIIFGLILLLFVYNLMKSASTIEKATSFLLLTIILIVGLFDHYFWTMYFGVLIMFIVFALNLAQIKKKDFN